MSRHYSMTVHVEQFDAAHTADIQKAAAEEWPGLEMRYREIEGKVLVGEAESQLCGEETEDEFAQRISKAIFQANQGPCKVRVDAIYLEALPYETYEFGPEDYEAVMRSVSRFDGYDSEAEEEEPSP